MTNAILKYEILSEEQLDTVAGGSIGETNVDVAFFMQLGYDVATFDLEKAFSDNGIKFSEANTFTNGKNTYSIKVNGEWANHPHWVALGYVLSKRKYPGFNGSWTDSKYVSSFMKNNFHTSDFGD